MENYEVDLKETIELRLMKRKIEEGRFKKEDYDKLLDLSNHHQSPLVNYLLGITHYFGLGVKEDKESGISYLEEVVAHANFELLMDMFFHLLKTDDNRIKVLIVDGLNKARDEMIEMGMALIDEDKFEDEEDAQPIYYC